MTQFQQNEYNLRHYSDLSELHVATYRKIHCLFNYVFRLWQQKTLSHSNFYVFLHSTVSNLESGNAGE